ncbi:MAG TPA: Asp-tRNA(Asn)/Glu-tRNA(Gln) amidotransferase subunit GatA [Candidatus Paceibacterota bacterium]
MLDIKTLTIAGARRDLDAKKYSSLELTKVYLSEIEKRDTESHSFLEVFKDSALAEAKAADERIYRDESAPLTGIPIAIKDNILIEGRVVSAGSKILENYIASYDSICTEKLKSQNVVFLGRTNMDEFAMGSSTENSAFGPSKNPHDTARTPGGSSGGSAAAVAGNLALAALGSDTGGSVRQPAAFCGVVGLKPTYGAVSRFGLIAMGSSLDQIGPLTKTVEDSRLLFEAIRGYDPNDSTSLENNAKSGKVIDGNHGRRLGVPRAFLKEGIQPDVLQNFEKTLSALEKAGYEIQDVEMPNLAHSLAVYYIVMPAEASTNLARFDGIRYGLSVPADNIEDTYRKTRGIGFGQEVRRRILVGTFVLSAGYADAYYRKARAVREIIKADFMNAFNSVDAIVTPTTPGPAFKFGEKSDPLSMYLEDIFTVPVNLAGVPAISVPAGSVLREKVMLPLGFQIIGKPEDEGLLFSIGKDVERAYPAPWRTA